MDIDPDISFERRKVGDEDISMDLDMEEETPTGNDMSLSLTDAQQYVQGEGRDWTCLPELPLETAPIQSTANIYRSSGTILKEAWECSIAECLPAELRTVTLYSLALVVRMAELATLTPGGMTDAHATLVNIWQLRTSHLSLHPSYDAGRVITTGTRGMPSKRHLEPAIEERLGGLLIDDVVIAKARYPVARTTHRKGNRAERAAKRDAIKQGRPPPERREREERIGKVIGTAVPDRKQRAALRESKRGRMKAYREARDLRNAEKVSQLDEQVSRAPTEQIDEQVLADLTEQNDEQLQGAFAEPSDDIYTEYQLLELPELPPRNTDEDTSARKPGKNRGRNKKMFEGVSESLPQANAEDQAMELTDVPQQNPHGDVSGKKPRKNRTSGAREVPDAERKRRQESRNQKILNRRHKKVDNYLSTMFSGIGMDQDKDVENQPKGKRPRNHPGLPGHLRAGAPKKGSSASTLPFERAVMAASPSLFNINTGINPGTAEQQPFDDEML